MVEASTLIDVNGRAREADHPHSRVVEFGLVKPLKLGLVGRDHQLTGAPVGDLPLLAVVVHGARALDADPRLERARLVVDTGMDDPTGATGLVVPESLLGLEDTNSRAGMALDQLPGDRCPENAAADNREVALGRGLVISIVRHRLPRSLPAAAAAASLAAGTVSSR